MTKIKKTRCRFCRSAGKKLFLKGERCYSAKCPLERKGAVAPGQHGQKMRRRLSVYGEELKEKQHIKKIYGIRERQCKNYFKKASKIKEGAGTKFLELLERRLDNVLFKGGLAPARSVAKQLVSHKQVLVDSKKVDVPSYEVRVDQVITFTTKGLNNKKINEFLKDKKVSVAPWIEKKAAAIKIKRLPVREEMEQDINEKLIIEFYSR